MQVLEPGNRILLGTSEARQRQSERVAAASPPLHFRGRSLRRHRITEAGSRRWENAKQRESYPSLGNQPAELGNCTFRLWT